MSADTSSGATEPQRGDIQHLLGIGNFAVLVLVLLVMVISIVLVIGLRNDVAALEDQARKSTKATKALQDELASLKESMSVTQPKARVAGMASNIDAAAPGRDCVIRPGDKSSLANCVELDTPRPR